MYFLSFVSYTEIDITEPCRYPVAVGLEKEYIPDKNIWATSKTNIARGPEYARLNGYKGKYYFVSLILRDVRPDKM